MQMIDFEYDGVSLSDNDLTLCKFDGIEDTINVGNSISINQVKASGSDKYMAAGYSYEEPFSAELQISKQPCSSDMLVFSDEEINKMMRWLNRKEYHVFKPIYDDGSFEGVYYYGTFNVQLIKAGLNVVGFHLTLNTNAPYGFMPEVTKTFTFNTVTTDKFVIEDTSDEVGNLYCDVTVKCLEAGNLTIKNSLDTENTVIVNNCVVDEIITLHGESKIIETSKEAHTKLYNDFNYNFIRLVNTYENNVNNFTSNIKCEMTVKYSPIRKVGIVV